MGRPRKFAKALCAQIFVRTNERQHARYLALGGAKWLREQLDLAEGRQRTQPAPTAHQPFPAFTVTDAKTGEPIPNSVNVREY